MKLNSLTPILCCFFLILPPKFTLIQTVEVKATWFTTDMLGNFYIVEDTRFEKYNIQGKLQKSYSNHTLGKVTYADVQNPLRILLYYSDFNQIQFVDNNLQPLGSPVNLNQLGLGENTVICAASQGGFWIFDAITARLLHFDNFNNLRQSSLPLWPVIGNDTIVSLREVNNQLFASTGSAIFVFDSFGNFSTRFDIATTRFQLRNQQLVYFNGQALCSFHTENHTTTSLPLPMAGSLAKVCTEGRYLYVLEKNQMKIYEVTDD